MESFFLLFGVMNTLIFLHQMIIPVRQVIVASRESADVGYVKIVNVIRSYVKRWLVYFFVDVVEMLWVSLGVKLGISNPLGGNVIWIALLFCLWKLFTFVFIFCKLWSWNKNE